MKNLIFFLLGGLTFICVAAGTTEIMTVKPATPKLTAVFTSYGDNAAVDDVKKYVKAGYVVKSMCARGNMYVITVMEKY